MKLIIGYLLVVGYLTWKSIYDGAFRKYPRTYDELMKLPSFTEDEALQERLNKQKDFKREHKKAYYKRKNEVG